ncbi:MAG: hypothetical protein O7E49_08425, partial [Gemmatimonadetes bacterium]|nr:hypothetical protein [Gemmatimonadota bacterium]
MAIAAPSTTLTSLGETVQLTVTAVFLDPTTQDETTRNITASDTGTIYESNDPTVITVDANGLVEAVGKGTAMIFASNGGASTSIEIAVESPLNEECTATILNRLVQVNADGTFAIGNVPVPLGAFRVRVVCERATGVERAQSPFVNGVPNGETPLGQITFGVTDPIPVFLEITSPATVLTPIANGAQLVTTG